MGFGSIREMPSSPMESGVARGVRGLGMFCALFCVIVGVRAAQNQQAKKTTATHPNPAPGAELYKRHCAVCHANDGKGNGPPPASSQFKEAPPDLTTLAQRHGGKFPDAYVSNVLRSGVKMPDHGTPEMPVWETAFKASNGSDEGQVATRIANLTNYLKSIQAK
jgi:mono/diheme cytochrome c family protein